MNRKLYKTVAACLVAGVAALLWSTSAVADEGPTHWIGVMCRSADDALRAQLGLDGGLVVERVVPKAPAAEAGVKRFDILIQAGDKKLGKVQDLVEVVKRNKGEELTVTLLRGGKKKTLKVTPAERPAHLNGGTDFVEPDFPKIEELIEKSMPLGEDGKPFRFKLFRPGVVVPQDLFKEGPFPKDLHISITKNGDNPAEIVVKQGDQEWKVTEDDMKQLPKEVRGYVNRLLGRDSPFRLHVETPKLSPRIAVPEPRRHDAEGREGFGPRLEKRLDQLFRGIEEIRRAVQGGDAHVPEGVAPGDEAPDVNVDLGAESPKPPKKDDKKKQ